jgi:hypothetical protein
VLGYEVDGVGDAARATSTIDVVQYDTTAALDGGAPYVGT